MAPSRRPPAAAALSLLLLALAASLAPTLSAPTTPTTPTTTLTPAPRAAATPETLGHPVAPAPAPSAAATEASPVAPAEAEKEEEEDEDAEESGRAAPGGDKVLRALSDRLYESCVQRDSLACLGLKAFYAAARFADAPEALAQVSSRRARVREAMADRVLVGSAATLLSTSLRRARETLASEAEADAGGAEGGEADVNQLQAEAKAGEEDDEGEAGVEGAGDGAEEGAKGEDGEEADDDDAEDKEDFATDRRRAGLPFTRKMMFPLLVGVVLKLASLIPLILGKLTIIGTMSLMSSKLSLLLLLLMSLRKWMSSGDSSSHTQVVSEPPFYSQPHAAASSYAHGYPDAHAYESQTHLTAAPPDYGHHVHMPAGTAVHPSALHAPYRRVFRTYHVVRGRQLGGDEDWTPRITQDGQPEERSATDAGAGAAEAVSEAGADAESVIENINGDSGSSTTDAPLSEVGGASTAQPPPTPLSVAVSAPAPEPSDATDPADVDAGADPLAAAPVGRSLRRRAPHAEVTSTSGFSVSNEDTQSDVRRLDEVEGRIVGH